MIQPTALKCEYLTDPLGVDRSDPTLSWKVVEDGSRGEVILSVEVQAASSADELVMGHPDLWDSGPLQPTDLNRLTYRGVEVPPGGGCYWRLRCRTAESGLSSWSEVAFFETAIDPACWLGAQWISGCEAPFSRTGYRPVNLLRNSFVLTRLPKRARLYITAKGLYRAFLNGQRIGSDELRPGWTDYRKLLPYQIYDVGGFLREGPNTLGALLGDGWFCGHIGIDMTRDTYGHTPELLALLVGDEGASPGTIVATGPAWETVPSEILYSDLLRGETIDARQRRDTWSDPRDSSPGWVPVNVRDFEGEVLAPALYPPVRVIAVSDPISVTSPVFNTVIYDFGQNCSGRVRLLISAESGREIIVRHGEILNHDGTLYRANLRLADQEDRFICSGGGEDKFEPSFTVHGFRFVEVVGLPEGYHLSNPHGLTLSVMSAELEPSLSFVTDNEMVNRLASNIWWGLRSNFLEVPMDCPQRNERLGWLGDARIFVRTAAYNADILTFFRKWLRDIRLAVSPDGMFPDFAPALWIERDGAPGYADGGVMVPWTLYEYYGDKGILEENYDAMSRFVGLVVRENPELIRTQRLGMNWGDWISLPEEDLSIGRGDGGLILESTHSTTPRDVFNTAIMVRSVALMARIAEVLGRTEDASHYSLLTERAKMVFTNTFIQADGSVTGGTQTGQILALAYDLVPDGLREGVLEAFLGALARHGGHLSTGTAGTELALQVLSDAGYWLEAYNLLLLEEYPSWGYQVIHGATTIWERWDGIKPDGSLQDIRMNSFNHYAFGSVGAWMVECIGGIRATAPGFATIELRPRVAAQLRACKCSYESVHGRIAVDWEVTDDFQRMCVDVPVGVEADVWLPARCSLSALMLDGGELIGASGVGATRMEDGFAVVSVLSGKYSFSGRHDDSFHNN